ncbi:Homeobox protein Hox-C6b [Frankliniella fusca]|uniref:Homeobox protein Hox-C6b n=1 Tax=Frankliniella fusca TaxID=407009 RepID=A0AAE1H2Q2_9NEOP|nr:Homeobox protein Hox-C6b [Frankliniella fusca]
MGWLWELPMGFGAAHGQRYSAHRNRAFVPMGIMGILPWGHGELGRVR